MNASASTLGLTFLVAALVVGMEQHREHQEGIRAYEQTRARNLSCKNLENSTNEHLNQATRSKNQKNPLPSFLTKSEQDHIFNTLELAHERLQREYNNLQLTHNQRRKIYPLLVRLELDYQPNHPYPLGRDGRYIFLGDPLSRADYGALLDPLLTSEQKEERETQNQENETWWSHIIERLEEDLNQQTETAPQPELEATPILVPLPEPLPAPPEPDPIPSPEPFPETEAIAPTRSSLRGSRNLLDLLEP